MRKNFLVTVMLIGVLALSGCGTASSVQEEDETALFESVTQTQEVNSENPDNSDNSMEEVVPEATESGATEAEVSTEAEETVATEEETSDGVWGATLMESDKDKIGTTNEYGLLYTVIYKGEFQDDSFAVYGALSYKNDPAQDTISVSDDVKHVFKTDENTVYQMIGGEDGPEDVTREEFIEHFGNCIKVGLYFEATVSNGVCSLVTIAA
ncbi:MAG: hypothetical protein E7307_08505 [Butyrivibrio sp.]|nr:hypothetical protein [Butyrivibrio sp.]